MSPPDSAAPQFSPGALQQLRVAVDHQLDAPADDYRDALLDACRRLRAEAQAKQLGPADLVKAVRDASAQTALGRAWDTAPELRYYRMLDDCLTAFSESDAQSREAP